MAISVTAVDEPPIFTVTSAAVGDDVITNEGKFAAVSFDEVTGIDATDNSEDEGRRNSHCAVRPMPRSDAEQANLAANAVTLGIRGADSSKFDFHPAADQTDNYTAQIRKMRPTLRSRRTPTRTTYTK